MRGFILGLTALSSALLAGAFSAKAQPLTVVEVGAPAVNCVFRVSCTIPVSDSTGTIELPYLATPGTAWLQSRTYTGEAGAPAAGKTGYEYRISLTEASGTADCIGGLVVNFGPVAKLPYKSCQMADVFVVTAGGLGTIGLRSAVKTGDVIEFELAKPLCLDGPPNNANTTFFFGLAADTVPMASTAEVWAEGTPPVYSVAARVPSH
jgi:hypothetical protein